MFTYLTSLLVFALTIGLLVLVHELGHFLCAKLFKVRVEEFGFGLPPRIFGRKKGETVYSVNAIPAGGFVKLSGEDEETSDPRGFATQSSWKRALIVVSGVVMNFLFALIIFTAIYTLGGPIATGKVLIDSVAAGSPAAQAGLKEGDHIIKLDKEKVSNPKKLSDYLQTKLGQETVLTYERNGETRFAALRPRPNPPEGQGPMGVTTLPDVVLKSFPVWEAALVGTTQSFKWSGIIFEGLKETLGDLVFKKQAPAEVGGIIRIGYIAHKATLEGWRAVLLWLGVFSLNLAILNILPIPALDGGRLVFVGIEAISKRKISAKVEKSVHGAGMVLLLILLLIVTYNDIIWVWANTSLKDKVQFFIPH